MGYCGHLVRFGSLGHIGCFDSRDGTRFERSSRVICRTRRGLEIGQVLAPAEGSRDTDGELLRGLTIEDELLLDRIRRRQDQAFEACADLVLRRGLPVVLMDVEHLFDGQSLYFYFLGDLTPEVEALTAELAEVYETSVRFRQFAETLTNGCGPKCGTDDSGCGHDACSSCALSNACGSRR